MKHFARRGAALVVVLWVVGILAMLVGSFTFDAHIESRIISHYRKRMKADSTWLPLPATIRMQPPLFGNVLAVSQAPFSIPTPSTACTVAP